MIQKFSEGNADILYEILIIYYSHFINPLNQNKEFYNNFIKYVIKKDKELNIFKRILNYIDDIETFLYVINENKDNIFKKYDGLKLDPIKLTSGLKLTRKNINKEKEETINNDNNHANQPETDEIENKDESENELDDIIKLIESIIKYSSENQMLVVYIKSTFWIYLLKQYNFPDWENLNNCYKLRELFKKYKNLINSLYKEEAKNSELNKKKKDNKDINSIIINDINRYYERDEFAFILNRNIKDFFEIKKGKITNSEILGAIEKFNPYFNIKDKVDNEKYKNNRETYIFDFINFGETSEAFNKTFHQLNFEEIFQENKKDFINKITSKIKDIPTFGNIIKLIDITRIQEKKKDYYNILKDKYELIIKNEIQSLSGDKLDKAVKIVSEFVSKIFLDENDTSFLEDKISKLEEKIKSLIYNELIKTYNGKEYEKMKNYIYDIFLNKLEDIDNIIKLIDNLSKDDNKIFLYKLMKKCEFTKEEFYSNNENKKIKLLCCLNKAERLNILGQDNKYASKLEITLDEIRNELENCSISKKLLETFLNIKKEKSEKKDEVKIEKEIIQKKDEIKTEKNENDGKKDEINNKIEKNIKNDISKEEIIIQKLGLIKMVLKEYDPMKRYGELKKNINDINEKFDKLNFIKDSLVIFHKNKYIKVIQDISNIINDIETKPINEFKTEAMNNYIDDLLKYESLCEKIKQLKDFLLFKKIFENSQGKDQSERFEDGLKKLNNLKKLFNESSSNIEVIFNEENFVNIFKNIKEELGKKDESKSKEFIEQMIEYFNIKDGKKIEELKIIIKSKKYEMVVKSIKFFFDNFSGTKITLPRNIELSEMKLKNLNSTLEQLKKNNIFDYESNSPFYRVFISFYEKKEAIDFLMSKINIDIDKFKKTIKGKLDPTNRSISIKDIDDTIECLGHFKILTSFSESSKIIDHLKELDEEKIKKFESYSKKYPSIIELDRKNEKDAFEKVYQIIQDASLIFKLDNEDFCYKIDGENNPIEIKELIDLKNKINIQPKNNINEEKNEEKDEEKSEAIKESDPYEMKCDKLIFFKKVISNLEIIYDKINLLREKGFNIPIRIDIVINYPEDIYKLNEQKKDFNFIKDYLLTIKNDYENQLNTIYENEKYLRLLYGKLFRKIKLHQEGNCKILEIMRYILNKTDNQDKIQEGQIYNEPIGEDYENEYKDYTKQIFDSISKYFISLFKNNNTNFQKHYENMLIKEKKKEKGIGIKKCEKISMEEYILYLFQEKLDKLPIAQNILICSNETSIEEIQSFFYRAILCEYNTLFIVEILESFNNFQHNKMYGFIDKLLSIKLENIKKDKENQKIKNIDKSRSKEYLNSFIVFVYKKLENEFSFLNELGKYTKKIAKKTEISEDDCIIKNESSVLENEKGNKMDVLNISNISHHSLRSIQDNEITQNIKVISSDVCGLGKSFKIKKMIKEEKLTYYYFALGGMLTKKIIYKKILDLFKKIKEVSKKQKNIEDQKIIIYKDDEQDIKIEEYSEFNNVAIHLDLIESEDTSLINEFLFSFLITKFYTNNEDIIYIPNNIKIYIEIPNSFENYLTKYGILNAFSIENIVLGELRKNEKINITNIKMLDLDLDPKLRSIFNRMIGKRDNKEIEQFIKENIGIEEYSYHQVQTFIKLFISQFSVLEGKIIFTNSQKNDITNKCIKYFSESTKYFTNGGFAKLITNTNQPIKDKFDLCLDAYENDLGKLQFKTPLIFIDKNTKKFNLEILPEINDDILTKCVDIVYVIDATGSMGHEIKAAKEYVISIFQELTEKYKDYNFQFGSVFYRDKVYSEEDEDEYFPLTNNMEDLKKNIYY